MVALEEKLKAIINFRWVVFTAVLIFNTIMLIFRTVPMIAIYAAYIALAVEILVNIIAYVLYKRKIGLKYLGQAIFAIDLMVLTTTIYFHGGVENRWGILPAIVIVFAGFYYPASTAMSFAGFAALLFGILTLVEYFGLVPHHGIYAFKSDIWHNAKYCLDYYMGMVSLCFASALLGRHLQLEIGKNERMLEQKIKMRTAQLEESKANLEQKVSSRTAELSKMVTALAKSEERVKQVAENAGAWIWEVNPQGLYTYASPVVERILGYKPEDIVGKKYFYDLFDPKVKETFKRQALAVFSRRGTFREFINPNLHKNGRVIYLETSGAPIVDERGQLVGYRGADSDVTERVLAEAELKEKMADLKTFHDAAVGRELKMIELEREINQLLVAQGKKPRYQRD